MNNFDDWSQIISKYLKSESDPLGSLTKHELEGDAARTAFIRAVLDRFLPEIYGIGSGQIMDTSGKMSGKIDIIIYRKDFPRLDLPGSRDIYLYESVIATIEVTAKLVKKTFFEALDRCASLAELNPQVDPKVLTGLAARNQLTLNENKQYVHPDPVRTARFNLIGRPLSFIYAFSGYKTSANMMVESLEAWLQRRRENNQPVEMKSIPAVIATQGCFAWRNSAPFTVRENCLMGVGFDAAPVRLIVLQLLHTLSRRLRVTTDSYGLKPGLDGYLSRMPPPEIESYVGKSVNPRVEVATLMGRATKLVDKRPESAVSRPVVKSVNKVVEKVAMEPVIEIQPKPVAEAPKPVVEAPKPVAEAPKPVVEAPKPVVEAPKPVVEAPKPVVEALKTLNSLNVKPEAVDAPFPEPSADLIPDLDPDPPEDGAVEPEASLPSLSFPAIDSAQKPNSVVSETTKPVVEKAARPSIDIDLESATKQRSKPVTTVDSANAFMETVKINMVKPKKEIVKEPKSDTSASEDFMETVKLNLSSKEPFPHLQPKSEPEPEPFTSTVPQLSQ